MRKKGVATDARSGQVLSLLIEFDDGSKIDWYALTREQRRYMKKRVPWLAEKVREYEKEGLTDPKRYSGAEP